MVEAKGSPGSYARNCLYYLHARIERPRALDGGNQVALLSQARLAAERGNYGLARFLLENPRACVERGHPDFDETVALWASSCAEMNDFERALEILRPIYSALRDGVSRDAIVRLANWISNAADFEIYSEGLDDLFRWALELNLSLILTATSPEGMLGPLRRTTRWLEKLGRGASANVIRDVLRQEAPGTGYVDRHNRERYVRDARLSEETDTFLITFDARIITDVVPKLKKMMESEDWIVTRRLIGATSGLTGETNG